MARSEFEDQYDHVLAKEEEERIEGELLKSKIRTLEPFEPICVEEDTTVAEAIELIVTSNGHKGVCVVDDLGQLIGIFTERDVLTQIVSRNRAASEVAVKEVMTPDPEALKPDDTAAFALNRMASQGFRTIPIVDDENHPIGILFTRHFVKFIVSLFQEATMNLPPDTELKNPDQLYGG